MPTISEVTRIGTVRRPTIKLASGGRLGGNRTTKHMHTRANTDTTCVSTKRQPVKEITLVRCVHNAWIDMCSLLVSVPIHTQGCTSVVHAFVYASHACTHGTCIARMSCMRTLVRIAGFDWELKLGIGTWE